MDYFGIIKRAFKLVWHNKVLWVLGLLASCAGGGGGSNFNFSGNSTGSGSSGDSGAGNSPEFERIIRDLTQWVNQNYQLLLTVGLALCLVLLIIGIIFWIIGILGRGGLIAGVDQLETTGNTTFKNAWSASTNLWKPLVGMHALLNLPSWILGLLILGMAGWAGYQFYQQLPAITRNGNIPDSMMGGLIAVACIGVPLICITALYGIVSSVLATFGERAIVLENRGSVEGIRAGWQLLKRNFANMFVLAILLWVIGLVVGMAFAIIGVLIALPTGIGTAMIASSNMNFSPAIIGTLACLGGIFGILATIINAIMTAFSSSVWTIAWHRVTDTPTRA
jgi:hypothetical protein